MHGYREAEEEDETPAEISAAGAQNCRAFTDPRGLVVLLSHGIIKT